ncbi:MAG: RHS repeat-associated core domain-containing protein, partial [Verrucomicrobiota bacterium]
SFTGTRRTGAEISIHGLGLAKWNYGFTNPATGTGSLQSAVLNNAPRFSYAQNAAGNRVSGAANIANQYAIAAQPGARFYSVAGSVKPGATVKISRTGGPTVAVPTAADGKFTARLPVPEDGTNPVKIPLTVTGTLPGAGDDGTDAIADDKRMIVLTPAEMPLTYGVHGSLVGDWRWTYHWDIEGRLAGMNTNPVARNAGMPNLTLRFSYDDIGRRIGKSVVHRKRVGTALVVTRTVTSSYVYDNWKLIAEEINDTAASGPVTRYYTWGKDIAGSLDATGGVGGLLAIHENGATYVPVYDGSGNIIALVDAQTGAQLAAWKRGPFGEPLEKRGDTSLCPFGFATHFTDEETGLVYFGYRYYSPVTGRWLSREPLGETESFNLFDYCHGDPVNKVDRIGLDEVTITNGEASYNFVDEVNGARGGWLKKFLDHVFHAKFDESKREFFGSVSLGSVSGGNVTLANGVSVPLSDLQTMADKRAMGRLDRCEQIRLLANDLNSWISRNEGAAAAGLIGTADKIVSAPFQALAGPDALTILGGIADKHDGFSFGVDLDSRNYARGVHLGSEIDDGIQIAGMAMILNPKNVSTFVRGASAAKNATRKVSVLGTYLPHNGKTYVQFAAEIGARRFALPDDKFLKMAQRAETIHGNPLYYNKLYLDSIANHGDLVRLNISRPEMQAIIGSNPNAFKTLRWEIGDLLSRGYTWGNDLKSLIPPAR